MIRTILVAVPGGDGDAASLAAALALARPFGAHLDALHVRFDAVNTAVAMTTDVGSGALTAGMLEELEQDAREREARAREIFTQFCDGAGIATTAAPSGDRSGPPTAEWHAETGEEPRWMSAYGVAADLVVARRASDDDVLARSTLEAVLLETGRPVVIPAAAPMPERIDRIAIAWKPTVQAARAVALAMPLIARARDVAVLTVEEAPGDAGDAERLVRNLRWHGLAARAERLPPGPEGAARTLLAGAALRADLLVMGGYGHTRLREWVFGGFTQAALADAPLPLLLAH